MGAGVGVTEPGTGPGWARLAQAVAEQLPPVEVDGVWVFSAVRHEGREYGTAVLSRVDGRRRLRPTSMPRLAKSEEAVLLERFRRYLRDHRQPVKGAEGTDTVSSVANVGQAQEGLS